MDDYPIQPISFNRVTVDDSFWSPRLETNRTVTIPVDFQRCEETERILNFDRAAGVDAGDHAGIFFNDSDVFKVIEGAAYSLQTHADPALDAYLDALIARIGAAQEPDGYLYTARTIRERQGHTDRLQADREGLTRWSNLRVNHELYNVGHMYEAAVAHYEATGKRTFLDIALKNADLVCQVFGPDARHDVPGHQEIEIGLVRLYRVTGDERYLRQAKFFLDERGQAEDRDLYANFENPGYMQDHLPVVEQDEAVGHAVRAVYMYAGMADVAALTGDAAYIAALDRLWDNVVGRKLYLTGGIGARHHGEAFGDDYELPNATAYAETCAALANVLWNQRMFLLHGHGKYIDVLERTLYNGFLSGISQGGDEFFYANPLASDGEWFFNYGTAATRSPWFSCSCCPTNVVRLLGSLGSYVYAQRNGDLYVNLFVGGGTTVNINGVDVGVTQWTHYPWDGNVTIQLDPAEETEFTLRVRVPGWALGRPVPSDLYRYMDARADVVALLVNGDLLDVEVVDGYAAVTRTWKHGDSVTLALATPVRRVVSHAAVAENSGRVALERGPLVFCVEGVDHGGSVADVTLPADAAITPVWDGDLVGGVLKLTWQDGDVQRTAIPYYAWSHRGVGDMAVWLRT